MTIGINDGLAQDQLTAIATVFDGGRLELRGASRPANSNSAATGTLIAAIDPLPADSLNLSGRSLLGVGLPWSDLDVDATGVVAYAILRNQADTRRIHLSASLTAGGGDIQLSRLDLAQHDKVDITAFSLTLGGA